MQETERFCAAPIFWAVGGCCTLCAIPGANRSTCRIFFIFSAGKSLVYIFPDALLSDWLIFLIRFPARLTGCDVFFTGSARKSAVMQAS